MVNSNIFQYWYYHFIIMISNVYSKQLCLTSLNGALANIEYS